MDDIAFHPRKARTEAQRSWLVRSPLGSGALGISTQESSFKAKLLGLGDHPAQ